MKKLLLPLILLSASCATTPEVSVKTTSAKKRKFEAGDCGVPNNGAPGLVVISGIFETGEYFLTIIVEDTATQAIAPKKEFEATTKKVACPVVPEGEAI